MAIMTDGYVRKDSNTKMGFLPPTSTEAMMMGDGSLMNSNAFRDAHPTTKYTPAELGMDITASPFYDPNKTQATKAEPQPSESEPVARGYPNGCFLGVWCRIAFSKSYFFASFSTSKL